MCKTGNSFEGKVLFRTKQTRAILAATCYSEKQPHCPREFHCAICGNSRKLSESFLFDSISRSSEWVTKSTIFRNSRECTQVIQINWDYLRGYSHAMWYNSYMGSVFHAGDMVCTENWKLGSPWLDLSSPIQDWSVSGEIYDLTTSYKYVLYLLYIPLLISSMLLHRVSNTVHSCGQAWQPGQDWPHWMVSWSHSVALSEWHFQDMLLCLADSRLSDCILCLFIPAFESCYYVKTRPATEQRTAELNVQSLDSLVALPVVWRHQEHQEGDFASEA